MSDIIDKIKAQGTQASVLMPELAEQMGRSDTLQIDVNTGGVPDSQNTVKEVDLSNHEKINQIRQALNDYKPICVKLTSGNSILVITTLNDYTYFGIKCLRSIVPYTYSAVGNFTVFLIEITENALKVTYKTVSVA